MKLILCFAALFAVYSIEVNAAPALQGHESVQADGQGLSSNLMDNLGDEGQIEQQRIKRHSNDRVCINSDTVCDLVWIVM